jgi:hypothetical protein
MAIMGINDASGNCALYRIAKSKYEHASERNGRQSAQADAAAFDKNTEEAPKRRSVEEYTQYLQDKFSYMSRSTTMEGVSATVSVSPAFIRQCANDPEKAAYLEENLAAIPDCVKSSVASAARNGIAKANLTYQFDANGDISIISVTANGSDGKVVKEKEESLIEKLMAKPTSTNSPSGSFDLYG